MAGVGRNVPEYLPAEIERNYMETLKFNELNLSPEILRGVKEMGFEEASPIQSKAIPIAMTG